MTNITDADLMAYADGVLPRHLRPLVRQALVRDPALLEKLESYLITNRGLAAPFDRLPPVPGRLRRLLLAPASPHPGERWWFALRRALNEVRAAERWRLPAWSLAGLAALMAATVLAWQLSLANGSRPQLAELEAKGLLLRGGQFQRVLEQMESNVATELASLKPTGTFLGRHNEWCRQYEVTRGQEARLAGIACRDNAGTWHVKGWAPLGPARPKADGYAAAGKETGESSDGLAGLEATLGKLMADVVLLPADEKRLLAHGWQLPR